MALRSPTHRTELARAASIAIIMAAAPAATLAQAVDVTGILRDASTLQPVADAVLQFMPGDLRVVSDAQGMFTVRLPSAAYEITIDHIAYGTQMTRWTLEPAAEPTLEIRIAPQAIELPQVEAEAPISSTERERRAEGAAVRRISREQLEEESARGRKLADVLRSHTVGLRIREGMYYTSDNPVPTRLLCIEAGGRGPTNFIGSSPAPGGGRPGAPAQGRPCNMVPVFRDGMRMPDPGPMLLGFRLQDLDRIEWLPVVAATARFGLQAENKGVLLLHSRTGVR